MRVAQMLDSLSVGGAQKMQLFLVETLCPLGVDLTVISLGDDEDSPMPGLLRAAGARVVHFPFPALFSPGAFVSLSRFLRAEKFDLLHAYLTYSNITGPLAGRLAGTPVIASLRSADFAFQNYSPRRAQLENFCIRYFATRVMANGEAVARFARLRLKDSRAVDIVPNAVELPAGVSSERRRQVRAALCGDPARPLVLSVGRMTRAKGFDDLIHAFAQVAARNPQAALVIAGGGDLFDDLQTSVRVLGLEGQVFLLGGRRDVPDLLAAADVYVNSSHWEGTPVSVLEAMAAGLPVVATRVGENPYLLEEGRAGLLVEAHAPQALAEAISDLLKDPSRREALGCAARERVRKVYTRDIWRRNLLGLYAQVTPQAVPYLAGLPASEAR